MQLSLILPCFNEEGNIRTVLKDALSWMQARAIDGEVIIVDDGSGDASPAILDRLAEECSPKVRVVHHPMNRGYGAALTSGFDAAKKEHCAFIDGDGQFRAQDLDRLFPLLASYAFVTGYREHRADPLRRKLNAFLYNTLLRMYLGIRVRDPNCAMKLFRRELWARIRPEAQGALFNAEVFALLGKHAIPFAEVPVPHYPRISGTQTGAKLSVILRMFREIRALKKRLG